MPNRREFLLTTGAAAVSYWVAGGAEAKESRSPNERISFASIGIDGKGASDSEDAGRAGDLVAICDVDDDKLNHAGQRRFKKAKKFNDFRKMLDEMGKSIDAVTVSTPDHAHALAASMAMKMKKHCFVQKPLTHSIHEARVLGQLAREMGVATQMGNQFTACSGLRKAAAAVRAGVLGTVKEVHVWTNRPIWPKAEIGPRRWRRPRPCIGTSGWLRRRRGRLARAINRSVGAAGGILDAARWATWHATPSTCLLPPWTSAIRSRCRPRPPAITGTAIRSGR